MGVLDTVTLDDAVAIYRNKMKRLHPDKGSSHEKARELPWAMDILRKHYEKTA